jgi:hypothetical protein
MSELYGQVCNLVSELADKSKLGSNAAFSAEAARLTNEIMLRAANPQEKNHILAKYYCLINSDSKAEIVKNVIDDLMKIAGLKYDASAFPQRPPKPKHFTTSAEMFADAEEARKKKNEEEDKRKAEEESKKADVKWSNKNIVNHVDYIKNAPGRTEDRLNASVALAMSAVQNKIQPIENLEDSAGSVIGSVMRSLQNKIE